MLNMDRRIPENYDPVAAAARLNASLAKDLSKIKRNLLLATIALFTTGIAVFFNRYTIFFAPPLLLGAFLPLMLYLVVRMQLREVLSRRDASPTPRISNLGKGRRPLQADAPAAVPRA
ncbi:MAG: hypothetical protein K8T91_16105 [Planctomycetes bacterium]|nr:hypothetical protein [Planctomycetota bacterium]